MLVSCQIFDYTNYLHNYTFSFFKKKKTYFCLCGHVYVETRAPWHYLPLLISAFIYVEVYSFLFSVYGCFNSMCLMPEEDGPLELELGIVMAAM